MGRDLLKAFLVVLAFASSPIWVIATLAGLMALLNHAANWTGRRWRSRHRFHLRHRAA